DVLAGAANLRKQLENVSLHGVPPVVAINAFPTDHRSEHDAIREIAGQMGARSAVCTHFAEGGRGAAELAEAVAEAAGGPDKFAFLYPDEASLREKIETVARRVYGADGVSYSPQAARQIETYERAGFGRLPVCIAKTHLSISSDPALKGAPTGWTLPVREVRASVGAGFVYPVCGDIRTMPGVRATRAAAHIDVDESGEIVGLSYRGQGGSPGRDGVSGRRSCSPGRPRTRPTSRSEGDPAVTVSAERQAPAGPGQVPAGRPRLLLPGLLPADPRLERYRVHPGAVTAVELDAGDEITVIDAEGRQRGGLAV